MTAIEDAVRAWAKGSLPTEAGAELLIRHGKTIHAGAPWIDVWEEPTADRPGSVSIDIDKLLYESGAFSGGERRLVAIACSLLGGPAVDLADELPGLDRDGMNLVLAAAAHAGGSNQDSGLKFDDAGNPVGFVRLDSLYPWPELDRA